MITGFNTDIEHGGVVYHVQTEDKGLESPLILSLVYVGGAILASKRSPYEDLIAEGFDEAVLTERLNRQHRLICAAIKAGRIDDLKRMGHREPELEQSTSEVSSPPSTEPATQPAEFEIVTNNQEAFEARSQPFEEQQEEVVVEDEPRVTSSLDPLPTAPGSGAYMVFDSRRKATRDKDEAEEGLCLNLLAEQEFRSGEALEVGIVVTYRSATSETPVGGVPVSVKILGTSFRPVIVSARTQRDGVAMISASIPRFTSGRAAILFRAVRGEESVEIRRVVRPS